MIHSAKSFEKQIGIKWLSGEKKRGSWRGMARVGDLWTVYRIYMPCNFPRPRLWRPFIKPFTFKLYYYRFATQSGIWCKKNFIEFWAIEMSSRHPSTTGIPSTISGQTHHNEDECVFANWSIKMMAVQQQLKQRGTRPGGDNNCCCDWYWAWGGRDAWVHVILRGWPKIDT